MQFLRTLPIAAIFALLLFVPAGRIDVPAFWAYLAIMWLGTSATLTALARKDPALLTERMRPPSDRDRTTRRLVVVPFAAHLVIAGLEVRDPSRVLLPLPWPMVLQPLGFVLFTAAFALVAWTLLTNPFASSAVRIQSERGHRVITTGPYAFVRHPMYSAVVLVCCGGGLALGSVASALVLALVIPVFVRRTRLEDRMLHEQLPGYREYATRVRARLIPGVY